MGKAIESVAMERGHEIIARIDLTEQRLWESETLSFADVAIEFTGPESAPENLKKCFNRQLPVVCGSTGWLHKWQEIVDVCQHQQGSLLYASNFSVGVNIFFALNEQLARLMAAQPNYDVSMEEIHHTEKKDAPSGTAITLAEQILRENTRKKRWINEPSKVMTDLSIISKRTEGVPGTHSILYQSPIDSIEITHIAHSRMGFATGAVLAAEFLKDKKGVYGMRDVLGVGA